MFFFSYSRWLTYRHLLRHPFINSINFRNQYQVTVNHLYLVINGILGVLIENIFLLQFKFYTNYLHLIFTTDLSILYNPLLYSNPFFWPPLFFPCAQEPESHQQSSSRSPSYSRDFTLTPEKDEQIGRRDLQKNNLY